jgi:HlyD family secretion protein
MPVLIDRWGGAAPLNARVARIEPSGFMKISALGVEEQRVWVVMAFADRRDAWASLGDGYRVEARVVVWQQPDGWKSRRAACSATAGVGGLRRWRRGAVRAVTIGQRNDVEAEMTGGRGWRPGRRVPSDQIRTARAWSRGLIHQSILRLRYNH